MALRLARDEHLHLFGNIDGGDVVKLLKEIKDEKEKLARKVPVPGAADADSAIAAEEPEAKPALDAENSQPESKIEMEVEASQTDSVAEATQMDTKSVSADQDGRNTAEAETIDASELPSTTESETPPTENKMAVDS